MPTTKTNLVRDDWILVGYLKLFRFMSVMMVETKCKLTTLTYSSNCSIFSAKKLETKSTAKNQENLENDKLRFRLNIDLRREKEDSWLNTMKTKIAFVKGRLNFSSKSATAANVHLMESLLDNWLKNNHTTVDILPSQSACVWGFLRILVSKLITQTRS